MYTQYDYNNELYHYGVKGMKWGVRHDPERTKRPIKKKSSSNYDKALKAALIITGVSAGLVVGTLAYRYGRMYGDAILSQGATIQSIGPKIRDFDFTSFYGTIDERSNQFYRNVFSNAHRDTASYLQPTKDIKIAGLKEAHKAYRQLVGFDTPTYKGRMSPKALQNEYYYFRRWGGLSESERRQFTDILAKRGYGAFKDFNDLNIWWGDTPTIFFDNKNINLINQKQIQGAKKSFAKAQSITKAGKAASAEALGWSVLPSSAYLSSIIAVARKQINDDSKSAYGKTYAELSDSQKEKVRNYGADAKKH